MPKGFRIKEAWLFTSIDEDDVEGLIGELINGVFMPFVATDIRRYELLMVRAIVIAKASGRRVRIKKLSTMEVVGIVDDKGMG